MKKKVLVVLFSILFILLAVSLFYYNSSYFIILNGKERIVIDLGEKYKEQGARTIINSKIKIEGEVDNTKIGKYEIKYYHNKKFKKRIVEVVDNIEPVIILNGVPDNLKTLVLCSLLSSIKNGL